MKNGCILFFVALISFNSLVRTGSSLLSGISDIVHESRVFVLPKKIDEFKQWITVRRGSMDVLNPLLHILRRRSNMKTPNFTVSELQVLEVISDQISIDILTAISNNVTNSDNIMQILDLTRKQYYSRCSRLSNIGLVGKQDGEIMLTSFGRLVYIAQLKIAHAFSHSSQLRMIDAIKSHSGLPEDQQKIIIDKLLDDSQLKNLVATAH